MLLFSQNQPPKCQENKHKVKGLQNWPSLLIHTKANVGEPSLGIRFAFHCNTLASHLLSMFRVFKCPFSKLLRRYYVIKSISFNLLTLEPPISMFLSYVICEYFCHMLIVNYSLLEVQGIKLVFIHVSKISLVILFLINTE